MTPLLLAKLTVAPSFVVIVTLVGRRLGPSVAGMLAAFPVVGGPILGLLVAEHGAGFGVTAAFAGAIGAASTMLFAYLYARACASRGALACLALGYAGFFVATGALYALPPNVVTGLAVPALAWWLAMRVFPIPDETPDPVAPGAWDLPARVVATVVLVVVVTGLAALLGPTLAGLVTPIPIITAVLAVFTHRAAGADAAAVLLRALVRGLLSFASFFVAIGVALPRVPVPWAFAIGIGTALVVQAFVLRLGLGAPPIRPTEA